MAGSVDYSCCLPSDLRGVLPRVPQDLKAPHVLSSVRRSRHAVGAAPSTSFAGFSRPRRFVCAKEFTGRRSASPGGSALVATARWRSSMLLTSVPARADDAVLEWNQIALAATVTAAQGPLPQIRTMAIVHVSVHDAVNAITCDYRTYLSIGCGPWGSPEAAAIAAAHRALVGLFPAQAPALDAARTASLDVARIDRSRSWNRIRRSRRGDDPCRSIERRIRAGAVSVHRARSRESWRVGRRRRSAAGAAGLGQRHAVGPARTSRNSSRTVHRRCTAGAMRATTTR